ncbi:MAG: polyphosphate kinase 1 [Ignavibacterium sp.]|nr:polyphosphate kinase 1 [Ignavibacterium sp.]MDW8376511.1 polyphosphate kinase 1 [Ignavibacteriales bacterium]
MNSKDLLKKYGRPENFFNRDLSWLEFNRRVLQEALNPDLPPLEKVKFVSIFSSNLDEFFMIRVSGLKEQIAANISEPTIDGLTPREQLVLIQKTLKPMLDELYELWTNGIVPTLRENDIILHTFDEFSSEEKAKLKEYFEKEIFPILTPLAFDPGRPFPYISNLSLNIAVLIRKSNGETHFARVKVPNIIPRLLQIDHIICPIRSKNGNGKPKARFIWLGDLIIENLSSLFPGMEVLEAHKFRITRDTDIEIQEDEADDLLSVIEENIKQRRFGNVVRLEVASQMPEFMLDTLIENLQISREDVHQVNGPLGLSDVMILYKLPFHQLKEKPYYPIILKEFEEEDIFSIIKQKDILLHHPFDSFTPVVDFIKRAASDPDVLAIKQTLYRVGNDSPIVKALIEAADRGKQVAVLVELKARFDEENNIYWARELEKVGVHVVYGLVGLKTHAKMTLVVRKEYDGVKRYVHLSTGNYNIVTSKLYTDIGFFTCDESICSDVTDVFNYLTGYSQQREFRELFVAPINIRVKFINLIFREIQNKKEGKDARIIMKFNSLTDPLMIAALYEASNAGVKVDLIIRGVCCLIPQKKDLSENISVRSIVGRYLEHSRIYYFYNNGNEEYYLSSADLMQRNLDRRVEIAFPIKNQSLKQELKTILEIYLKDNVKARELDSEGKYYFVRPKSKEKHIYSQELLMERAQLTSKKTKKSIRTK